MEVDGAGPHLVKGEMVYARSRTFIRSRLEDNPDLTQTGDYAARLAALPKDLRTAYKEGRFDLSLKDNPNQCIPTAWVLAAQARWEETPPRDIPMCAIGGDIAQGGDDETVLAPRHDGWFAPLIAIPGSQTPDGPSVAGRIIAVRRHNCHVLIDMGGGYGGSTSDPLPGHTPSELLHCSQ